MPWSGIAFIGATCSLALTAVLGLAGPMPPHHWRAIALLAALAALTPLFTVHGPRQTVYDLAAVFVVAAALLAPPAFAALVGLPACIVDWARRRASLISLAHNGAAIALAALTASLLAHNPASLSPLPRILALLLAVCSYAGIITGSDALFGYFARGHPRPRLPTAAIGAEATLGALGVGLAALVVSAPWRAPFALAPLLFIHPLQRLPALEEEAARDAKTGLLNMRCFEPELERMCSLERQVARPVSLLVLDLDHLREINNRFGHLAGDAVIRAVAALIQGQLRASDRAARFGGEEFLVAIPDVDPAEALAVATRLREAVASSLFHGEDPPFTSRATVSVGVAHAPGDATSSRELFHAADLALLRAKLLGRNCVVERREIDSSDSQTAALPHALAAPDRLRPHFL